MSLAADIKYQKYEKNGDEVRKVEPEKDPDQAYRDETNNLGFALADYYDFARVNYQHPLLIRSIIWELLAFTGGVLFFYLPFFAYNYSVLSESGKNNDYHTPAFTAYCCNFLAHYMQMLTTIRNYTKFYLFTCTFGIMLMFPLFSILLDKMGDDLNFRMNEIFYHEIFVHFSSVILSVGMIAYIIYGFKIYKMIFWAPQFFQPNYNNS